MCVSCIRRSLLLYYSHHRTLCNRQLLEKEQAIAIGMRKQGLIMASPDQLREAATELPSPEFLAASAKPMDFSPVMPGTPIEQTAAPLDLAAFTLPKDTAPDAPSDFTAANAAIDAAFGKADEPMDGSELDFLDATFNRIIETA